MAKTYTLDGGIRVTRTLRDTAISTARKKGTTEYDAAHSFFGGVVLERWEDQYRTETGRDPSPDEGLVIRYSCDTCLFATEDMFGQFWCRKATTVNPRPRPIREGQAPSEACPLYQPRESASPDGATARRADAPTPQLAT